jgi:CDP-glycerol glycerophosphotransferase (TagB/SpsB family)
MCIPLHINDEFYVKLYSNKGELAMKSQVYDYKFSVIMPIYNVEKFLSEAVDSVLHQTIGIENIQIILVNDESPDNSEEICLKYQAEYPDNVVYVKKPNGGVSSARNYGIQFARGRYIQFLDPDDSVSPNTFENVYAFFEENEEEIDLVAIPIFFFEGKKGKHVLNNKFSSTRILDLEERPDLILTHCCSTFIKNEVMNNFAFDESCRIGEDAKLVNLIIAQKMKYGVVKQARFNYRVRADGTSAMQNAQKNKDWYNHSLLTFSTDLVNKTTRLDGTVPRFIQYVIMHDLKWKFFVKDISETPLSQSEYEEFVQLIESLLHYMDDDVIMNTKNVSHYYLYHALKMKYKDDYSKVVFENKEEDDLYLCLHEDIVARLSTEVLTVEILEERQTTVHLEGFWGSLFNNDDVEIFAEVENERFKTEKIIRNVNNYVSLGEIIKRYPGFSLDIPKDVFRKGSHIEFFITKNGVTQNVKLRFFKYSGLNQGLRNSYAAKDEHIFYYRDRKLYAENNTVFNRIIKEAKYLFSLNRRKKRAKKAQKSALNKAIVARLAHYGTRIFSRKPVWIFVDRQDKADDSAEHLFRYAMQKNDGIKKYFVIKKDSADYERLKQYGKVVAYRSLQHKLLTMSASKVISTHADVWVVNPFFKTDVYYRDLMTYDFVFLQHGVTMVDHSHWLNKYNKNIRLMVTAANKEYESIINGDYNFTKENVFLGGFPRYDNLEKSNGQKQILIMPTWRKALVSPKNQALGIRPYNPYFKESEYFKRYNDLINDEELLRFAEEQGYKIKFFPHPDIQQQLPDFNQNEKVDFVDYNTSYQLMFNSSDIMITDFSSVAFDFAYTKKPVIYYQYEKSYHFKLDYYNYETMGFGDTIAKHEDLIAKIKFYIENNSEMEDKYKARVDSFFAYTDKNNRERVYSAIMDIDR